MNWLRKRLRDWLGITSLEKDHDRLFDFMNQLGVRLDRESNRLDARIAELDKLTAVDADMGVRGPCTIILTGVYRGKGYVAFYELDFEEFRHMVEDFKLRKKHGLIRNVDRIVHDGGSFDFLP